MKLLKIGQDGYFIEDVIVDKIPTITQVQVIDEKEISVEINDPQYVETPCPGGFYLPRWNGEEWIEGKFFTSEEIQEKLEDSKLQKRKEIKQSCYNTIINGFDTDIKYGEPRHYSLDEFSQKNIDDQMIQLQASEIKNALWHDDSKVMHDLWTFAEFKEFFTQYKMFILSCRLKSDMLEERINIATTQEELENIAWDIELTEEEQLQINTLLSGMFEGVVTGV